MLALRLGRRHRHQRLLRQHRWDVASQGGPQTYGLPLGVALHRALVEGAGDAGRRHPCAARTGSAAGVISPLPANPSPHYAFDVWLGGRVPVCRLSGMPATSSATAVANERPGVASGPELSVQAGRLESLSRHLQQGLQLTVTPEPLSPNAQQTLRLWCEKMLIRAEREGPEGNLRRHWLLSDLLEAYFILRGRWYLGPRRSLAPCRFSGARGDRRASGPARSN